MGTNSSVSAADENVDLVPIMVPIGAVIACCIGLAVWSSVRKACGNETLDAKEEI